jgi:hypothetical protein
LTEAAAVDPLASSLLPDALRKCTTRKATSSTATKIDADIFMVRPVPGRNVVGTDCC